MAHMNIRPGYMDENDIVMIDPILRQPVVPAVGAIAITDCIEGDIRMYAGGYDGIISEFSLLKSKRSSPYLGCFKGHILGIRSLFVWEKRKLLFSGASTLCMCAFC